MIKGTRCKNARGKRKLQNPASVPSNILGDGSVYAHKGNMYFSSNGFTKRHLSLAERAIPLLGPDSNRPSSSPASSSSAASGV